MSKHPYLKILSEHSPFTIWQVDGEWVRANLNGQFTNFAQHYRFPFIPKYEFWIDKEASPSENRFFIDHLLIEWILMNKGKKYAKAIAKADRKERGERMKSAKGKQLKALSDEKRVKKIHKKLLKSYSSENLEVWIVRGELVRDVYFIDFTEGGHQFVYDFVPKTEVWIDDDITRGERKFIILHELHERALMAQGKKYKEAHASASRIEHICRHHRKDLKPNLAQALRDNS
ncbi:MAG: hypothetical protein ACD_66C00151G0006 [uncultured bacterium]|uniref:Uncharacterized protein n=1 Tax=Candidatus Uhrbacteria bacterium GW2011_GWC1_41_20 TaxID=1618983 RepID=A0A0G0V8Y3_9BACT|nr:MAG: hypothetical protein ACD_66C00151G0006 [uncultured bacterium]KKR21472.1 MAG: hypothetical protein UT52_C0028G0001 [Candidatus Uhrbacteria bacterium GW2011_GWE1_39_46]KKR63091.1 MAG: hypothetical protein UU04_C0027G0001 [Candidatus Uhrbacteria bacterium GW2011_GWC2_40_450]KKR89486.1 MAG: hypothetical protein UU40_C0024G0001 [Candidatus Uhrbacteria bacterium GW2011_GWD2_41_121]KKR89503.1 MAG: hypothetical protein UU36_C0025G0002 [Candidatus Uhrbacteria bacterium GW2011_GWE2_41_1153]KKR94